jgi:hypothetical protein
MLHCIQTMFRLIIYSITLTELLNVKKLLRHLVGVPIDKNNILWFEPVHVYARRLIDVFVSDTKHYLPHLQHVR